NLEEIVLSDLEDPVSDQQHYSGTDVSDRITAGAKITIPDIKNDNMYLQVLEKSANPYQTYLELRQAYLGTPSFYFDVANFFYRKGTKDKALLVLSSLADLQIENADLFKTIA